MTTDKDEDFVGREALRERREHPQRTLVGLELEGNEPAGHGDGVYAGRQQVGVVTSGTRSPVLKKNIALARVAVQHRDLGTALEVGKLDGQQKRIGAQVVPLPVLRPGQDATPLVAMAKLIESFTPEQVEAFHRDGFLVVEEGLISDKALELLEQRYLRLFDGRVRDRDQAGRGQLGQGPRSRGPHPAALQRLAGGHRDRRPGPLREDRPARRTADELPGRADPPGQRALEASRDEGDRLPPGRLVRRLPRAPGDGDLLDVAARDAGRRRPDRLRARLEPLAVDAAGALAVPRARGLARGRPGGEAGGRRDGGRARSS